MKHHHGLIAIIILIAAGLFFLYPKTGDAPSDNPPMDDRNAASPMADESDMKEEPAVQSKILGDLKDVSGGTAHGEAMATFNGETYVLDAAFEGLPDPEGTDFYEGWVVRRGDDMSVISTGRAENEGNTLYTNVFSSEENLMDHDYYVLTLEPDDGDPAPATHILDGVMVEIPLN